MTDPPNLPRIPADQIEPPMRKVSDMKPGEQAALPPSSFVADHQGRLWVSTRSYFVPGYPTSEHILLVERAEKGFNFWLNKKGKIPLRQDGRQVSAGCRVTQSA